MNKGGRKKHTRATEEEGAPAVEEGAHQLSPSATPARIPSPPGHMDVQALPSVDDKEGGGSPG